MSRKAITIEDRVREVCSYASKEEIRAIRGICDNALYFRWPEDAARSPKPKRTRKPKEAPQTRLAGVE